MAKEQTMSYINFLNSKTVSLKAAESGQSFNIHRDLLAAKSKTIISAFERGFVEGTKGIYTFQDTSDETLARFIEWAYTGDYPAIINPTSDHGRKTLKSEPDQPNHETDVTSENHPLLSHIHLYIFCSVYLIPDLQNLAFDRIRANFTELGKPDSPNTQLDVIAALRISFCKVLAPDPLLDWLAKYTAYTVDKLRVQSDFHDLLQESSSLTLRMVSLLNPARSAPWDNKPPKHDYQGPKTIGISDCPDIAATITTITIITPDCSDGTAAATIIKSTLNRVRTHMGQCRFRIHDSMTSWSEQARQIDTPRIPLKSSLEVEGSKATCLSWSFV